MSTYTTARLIRAGHGILTTADGEPIFTALGPNGAANEARLIAIWSAHDQIVAENVALREKLALKDDIFNAAINAALTLPDPVREQLVEALKIGRDVMALVGVQDHLIDYDAVSKGRKIVADALKAAGATL